jgi:hypothetical protein
MNVAKVYKNAVSTLKPNAEKLAASQLEYIERMENARRIVDQQIAEGRTARELYDAACALRNVKEDKMTTAVRVVLLGLVRKEAIKR